MDALSNAITQILLAALNIESLTQDDFALCSD